jgi:TusE/DsrC/DsvC family sulfur relay protein
MEKVIAGATIQRQRRRLPHRFFPMEQRNRNRIGTEANITMTPRHWEVIAYLQKEFKNESPLSIRKIGKSGVVDIKEFYQLFPMAPLKTASKIAGIPKPVSCIVNPSQSKISHERI